MAERRRRRLPESFWPVPKISALRTPRPAREHSAFDPAVRTAVITFTAILMSPNWSILTSKGKPSRIGSSPLWLIEPYNFQMEGEQ